MLAVLEKPTATHPLAFPFRVKSMKLSSLLFVFIPKNTSHLVVVDSPQPSGSPRDRRYCGGVLCAEDQHKIELLTKQCTNVTIISRK